MPLDPRQISAAQYLARGQTQEEVARRVGVSRRTITRWQASEEFRNLSYGLINSNKPEPPLQAPQQPPERCQHPLGLRPQDLVVDALEAVRSVLKDPDSRNTDRLKAASLVGEWAGLGQQKSKMAELEGLKILCEAGWIPDEVLRVVEQQDIEMCERIAAAFYGCFHNGRSEEPAKEPNPPPWPRDPWS